jgi:hypothetical protein
LVQEQWEQQQVLVLVGPWLLQQGMGRQQGQEQQQQEQWRPKMGRT